MTRGPFNVNSTAWTAYVVQSQCKKIIVCEVNQAGTVDYYVSTTGSESDKRARPGGKEYVFESERWLFWNDTPFYLKTASGSVNFDADELQQ